MLHLVDGSFAGVSVKIKYSPTFPRLTTGDWRHKKPLLKGLGIDYLNALVASRVSLRLLVYRKDQSLVYIRDSRSRMAIASFFPWIPERLE